MSKRRIKKVKPRRVRALEFYAKGTPFKPKVVQSKRVYKRSKMKNFDI